MTLFAGLGGFDERRRNLDLRDKLAHIDQMLADHDRKRQEIRLAPWQMALGGMTSGAVLFAAGAAFMQFFAN